MQVRSCRTLRNTQHRSDLAMREPFYVVQDDHRPLPVSQPRERLRQPPTELVSFSRITEGCRRQLRQLVRIAYLAPPYEIQRRIRHDTVEPRPERLIREKTVQRSKGVEKPFLHRVLRVLVREHDRAANSIGTPLVQPHERSERFATSLLSEHIQC